MSETTNHCVARLFQLSDWSPFGTAVITYTPGLRSLSASSTGKLVTISSLSCDPSELEPQVRKGSQQADESELRYRPCAVLDNPIVNQQPADGRLEEIQRLSTLPDGYAGESLGGHIAMNAAVTRLYVSNRGHDSLAVFAIADDGQITLLQHASTHSRSPRHFHLAEAIGRIIVAHQNGNSVVVLALEDDGRIRERKAALPVPQAAFIGALDAIRMTSIHK